MITRRKAIDPSSVNASVATGGRLRVEQSLIARIATNGRLCARA